MSIRVAIADDHPVVLSGLADYLHTASDLEIVARARNGVEALDAVRRLNPDVLVLDIRMPVMDGLAVLREMKREQLATAVVVLTALDNDEAAEAACLGARGVVLKDLVADELVRCVREVHAGGQWLDRGVATRAVSKLLDRESNLRTTTALLTQRELEVARMAAEGLPSKAIARKLSITEGTAKLHLHHIYEKLKISGRIALARYLHSQQLD